MAPSDESLRKTDTPGPATEDIEAAVRIPDDQIERSANRMLPAIEEMERQRRGATGRGVGFPILEINGMTSGMRAGQLTIVAGRPGVGKSSFVLSTAVNAAAHGTPTLVVSFEVRTLDVINKMLACSGSVDTVRMDSGRLENHEMGRLVNAATNLARAPLWTVSKAYCDIERLVEEVRQCHEKNKLALVVIDNLQQLTTKVLRDNRHQELVIVVRAIKALAMELGIPFLMTSQVNRNADKQTDYRGTRRIGLRDLADSGACEGEANVVLLVHTPDQEDEQEICERIIGIAKNQFGPTGEISVIFLKQYGRFEERAPSSRS